MADMIEERASGAANHRRTMLWMGAAAALLLPLVAMQFTDEVQWDTADFIEMGAMLLVAGIALELVMRLVRGGAYRVMFGAAIVLAFLLVWLQLAVGIL